MGATVVVSLAIAATTSADPVTGGSSRLKPNARALEELSEMGITVQITGRGYYQRGAQFPITGGEIEVHDEVRALIEHAGGLEFTDHDGNRVKFARFTVSIVHDRLKLFARSDHETVRFLDIAPANISGTDSSMTMKHAKLTLAKEGAEILSATFGAPFEKGDPSGRLTIQASVG